MIMPLPGNVRGAGRIGEYIEIMLEAMYLLRRSGFSIQRLIMQWRKFCEKKARCIS